MGTFAMRVGLLLAFFASSAWCSDTSEGICPLHYSPENSLKTSRKVALNHEEEFSQCGWYQRHSCCSVDDAQKVYEQTQTEFSKYSNVSESCSELIGLLSCAPCSPQQGRNYRNYTFYGETAPTLVICQDFCTRLFEQCKDAVKGDTLVSKQYPDEKMFCRSFAGVLV